MKVIGRGEQEIVAEFFGRSSAHPIEYMIIPLLLALHAYARLFKQIMRHKTAGDSILFAKVKLDKFAKATAVIVARCLCVAKRLEQWISFCF